MVDAVSKMADVARSSFNSQLASVMESLLAAAVCEISRIFEGSLSASQAEVQRGREEVALLHRKLEALEGRLREASSGRKAGAGTTFDPSGSAQDQCPGLGKAADVLEAGPRVTAHQVKAEQEKELDRAEMRQVHIKEESLGEDPGPRSEEGVETGVRGGSSPPCPAAETRLEARADGTVRWVVLPEGACPSPVLSPKCEEGEGPWVAGLECETQQPRPSGMLGGNTVGGARMGLSPTLSHAPRNGHTHRPGQDHTHRPGQDHAHRNGHAHRPGQDHAPRNGHTHRPGQDHAPRNGHAHRPGQDHAPKNGNTHRPGQDHAPRNGHAHRPGQDHAPRNGHAHRPFLDHAHRQSPDHALSSSPPAPATRLPWDSPPQPGHRPPGGQEEGALQRSLYGAAVPRPAATASCLSVRERPYGCSYCGKAFFYPSQHRSHLLRHTGERRYPCAHCGKSFVTPSERSVHVRVHTGEKPYGCALCGKRFNRTGNLRAHERHVHLGKRPFSCADCGKTFGQKGNLRTHQQRVHQAPKP